MKRTSEIYGKIIPRSYFCFVKLSVILPTLVTWQFLFGQTIGINLNREDAMNGYVLFTAHNVNGQYLIDNCGEVVHQWDNTSGLDLHAKLLPSGNLVYLRSNKIYEEDWSGNIVVEITANTSNFNFSYEVIKLPNGNYLCLGRRGMSTQEFIDQGFNLDGASPAVVDVVVEVNPSGTIVWEWNIADHVIQERDANLGNYGVVADHPELLNLDAISTYDWTNWESFMINGMDYNVELDQIVLSIRKMSEIAVIDHSTTTAEAAGHTGGNSGKGGDILYRWGNPQNYGRGTAADRELYFQHNPNWIQNGEHAGKLICYNNGLSRTVPALNYSEVPILNTPIDENGHYHIQEGMPFGPMTPDINFQGNNEDAPFYSGYTSAATMLPNGNTFITEGLASHILELNIEGELVWSYQAPTAGWLFRAEKYPVDYPAFEGKDLTPYGTIPDDNSTYDCELFSTVSEKFNDESVITINSLNATELIVSNGIAGRTEYKIIDMQGKLHQSGEVLFGERRIPIQALGRGMFIIRFNDKQGKIYSSIRFIKV